MRYEIVPISPPGVDTSREQYAIYLENYAIYVAAVQARKSEVKAAAKVAKNASRQKELAKSEKKLKAEVVKSSESSGSAHPVLKDSDKGGKTSSVSVSSLKTSPGSNLVKNQKNRKAKVARKAKTEIEHLSLKVKKLSLQKKVEKLESKGSVGGSDAPKTSNKVKSRADLQTAFKNTQREYAALLKEHKSSGKGPLPVFAKMWEVARAEVLKKASAVAPHK